jgi:hypothetical protein
MDQIYEKTRTKKALLCIFKPPNGKPAEESSDFIVILGLEHNLANKCCFKEHFALYCLLHSRLLFSKVGIRNFSPHLRNSAILRTTKLIAELRTIKSCGIAIADLQNVISAIPQLSAVFGQFHYFIIPFPQLRMV